MSERTSNSVHLFETLIEVKSVSHEQAVEWEHRHRFRQQNLVQEVRRAGEHVRQHVVVVKPSVDVLLLDRVHEIILALQIPLGVLASEVVEEVFESVDRGFHEIIGGNAPLPPVHQCGRKLDPVRLGKL